MKTHLRLIVCGGREYEDRAMVYYILDLIHSTRIIAEIIEGGAKGADQLAREWAESRGVKYTTVHAKWTLYGKPAGRIRNSWMLQLKPDGVVAFPGGGGTADMIRKSREAGVKVWEPVKELGEINGCDYRSYSPRPNQTPIY